MLARRILGIVLLVVGIALMAMGMHGSGSITTQIANAFTGHQTDSTAWYILTGVPLLIIGVGMTLDGFWHGRHGRVA